MTQNCPITSSCPTVHPHRRQELRQVPGTDVESSRQRLSRNRHRLGESLAEGGEVEQLSIAIIILYFQDKLSVFKPTTTLLFTIKNAQTVKLKITLSFNLNQSCQLSRFHLVTHAFACLHTPHIQFLTAKNKK